MDTIPVTVVTGFLGAGKSTLLEQWLGELPRESTVVLINEQGEVGIDGALLAKRAARLREITGGCICCVAQAEIDAALAEFAASTPRPTRILVETSGAASPAGVIRTLTGGTARAELRLDGVITVIDAARARQVLAFDLTREQLGFADMVVISHVDQCEQAQLAVLEAELETHAPGAVMTRARHGQLEGTKTLLESLAQRSGVLRVPPEQVERAGGHGIGAVSLVHDGELDEERFGDWVEQTLGTFQARIMRVKGILAVKGVDARVIVQGVGEAIEVTLGSAWNEAERTSRLVILGLGLDFDAATLEAGFAACTTKSELQDRV